MLSHDGDHKHAPICCKLSDEVTDYIQVGENTS